MMDLAYLNGEYLSLSDAKVSVLDRGFLFGDGVYEVIPVYENNLLYGLKPHLTRLDNSLRAIDIEPTLTHEDWLAIFKRLLTQEHLPTCSVYLQVTRGTDDKRYHPYTTAPKQTTTLAFLNNTTIKPKAEKQQGYHATLHEDIRWYECSIKSINLLPNSLLMHRGIKRGFSEVILHRNNMLTEGCSSNVFIVKSDEVITPPNSKHILPGITRQLVLEQLSKQHIACSERNITLDELYAADEVWLTSSTKEIAPVVKIDDHIINDGQAGSMWHKVYDYYADTVRK
jgi:D-alanine transaminase